MRRRPGARTAAALALCVGLSPALDTGASEPPAPEARIPIDRRLDVLAEQADDPAALLSQAARELGSWTVELAGVRIDGAVLNAILERGDPELVRAAREELGRPVDLPDFLLFLDDVLAAGRRGLRGSDVVVPSGRARAAGILLHPQEVFGTTPRRYGAADELAIDRPLAPRAYPPAEDGELLGPRWTARFENPTTEAEMLAALRDARPASGLSERVGSLIDQLRAQGAEVVLTSTVRRRERGYLMWGAFLLSRAASAAEFERTRVRLERARHDWRLAVPIRWSHPAGWRAGAEAAREMADTYQVVYATEEGARASNHYDGVAVDLVALRLPRRLELQAPGGVREVFDLTSPSEARDLSLSPALIRWIEKSFELRKLESDYPHWNDAR